jgi:hypothetical protein
MKQVLEGVVVIAALLLGVLLFREWTQRGSSPAEAHMGATSDPGPAPAHPPADAVLSLPPVKVKRPARRNLDSTTPPPPPPQAAPSR